jgi:hypothetical protein
MPELISPIQVPPIIKKPSHHRLLWSALIAGLIIIICLILGFLFERRAADRKKQQESLKNFADQLQTQNANGAETAPDRPGEMRLSAAKTELAVGETFTVEILMNTKDSNIVLGGAVVNYDSDKLKLVSDTGALTDNSVLNMSIVNEAKSGAVEVVRGIPGNADYLDSGNGYTGQSGLLATLKFKTLVAGSAQISFQPDRSNLILDDGRGTAMKMSFKDLTIEIK